jgi:pyruvate/2-oxoglutarate dehydrogenase complex dihydrolipoamide dehydrogenase (E3) component
MNVANGQPEALDLDDGGASEMAGIWLGCPYNRELVENVHPPAWVNPTPTGRYNLVVVGAGAAGLVSAVGAAGLGAKVAIVEKHLMGGDCLNVGCVPSKSLLRAARAVHAVRGSETLGVRTKSPVDLDFGAVMARMRRQRAGISHHDSAQRLANLGVDVYLGEAKFVGPDAIEVAGRRLAFSRAVIATGARAANLPVPGLAEVGYLTNETVFSLRELPRRLTVIGAGPIGCELAQAFRRFGSQVSVVSLDERLLPREDADAAAVLTTQFEREGVQMALGARIRRIERRAEGKVIIYEQRGRTEEVISDEILVAVGRSPNLEGLALDAAGVEFDRTGIKVDDHLRTANKRVYAAGDICSAYKFTHAADAMARIVLQNALFFGRKRASTLIIPSCIYTEPEIAHVGAYEGEQTLTVLLAQVDRAILDGETDGFARIHADRRGRILGATLVSPHAGESIAQIALAMTGGLSLRDFSRTIFPYPTQAEAWKKLGDTWSRSRLTQGRRRLLERILAWRR